MSARTPRSDEVISSMAARRAEQASIDLLHELDAFASPIEKVFVATMLAHGWCTWFQMGRPLDRSVRESLRAAGLILPERETRWGDKTRVYVDDRFYPCSACAAQPTIQLAGRVIRPDFAFAWTADEHLTKIIVELDGHDFHERTPEQAQSDKSRDRELQSLGWMVLRYTGREVLRAPVECLHETERLLEAKSRAAFDTQLVEPESEVTS